MILNYLNWLKWKSVNCLTSYGFDGDNTPIIQGSATGALAGEEKWVESIEELMDAVDSLYSIASPSG